MKSRRLGQDKVALMNLIQKWINSKLISLRQNKSTRQKNCILSGWVLIGCKSNFSSLDIFDGRFSLFEKPAKNHRDGYVVILNWFLLWLACYWLTPCLPIFRGISQCLRHVVLIRKLSFHLKYSHVTEIRIFPSNNTQITLWPYRHSPVSL